MLITIVLPVTGADIGQTSEYFEAHRSADVELTVTAIDQGPASIESDLDIALAAPAIVRRVREAEANGADAVIINCMADPGLYASREAVRIPVMAPAQSAFGLAATLSDRFSVLGTTSRDIPFTRDMWRRYGHMDRGASIRVVDLPVLELQEDPPRLLERLIAASIDAIQLDGAGALIFGCTLMAPHREDLEAALAERGHRGIPVIDPLAVALRTAEMLVRLGIRPSDATWAPVA